MRFVIPYKMKRYMLEANAELPALLHHVTQRTRTKCSLSPCLAHRHSNLHVL